MSDLVERLSGMLATGKDSALLRFGLGQALLNDDRSAEAAVHLARAVEQDPGYSAAWKLLGQALLDERDEAGAAAAWRRGIAAAQTAGDEQAARTMTVFLRRLERASRES